MQADKSNPALRPLTRKGAASALVFLLAAAGSAVWLGYCLRLLTQGHTLLGTSSYGAAWGISIAYIVHVIGISHVGIAVSAVVRILKLRKYRVLARLAEWVTLVALASAVVQIALDVGRPDRFVLQILAHGRWHAPIVWSMTVIFTYFALSAVYLYLSMRRDLWALAGMELPRKRLYRLLAAGYVDTPASRERHSRALFWLAIVLVPVMVAVHSVYGFFFGLMPARAGWSNPLQAPYFVLGAIVSGLSAVVVIAALLRRAYGWEKHLPETLFKTLGAWLALFVFLLLYFILSEHLTFQYATLPAERALSDALISGQYALPFWVTLVAGLLVPFGYLSGQALRPGFVRVGLTATAALLINIALWWKRYLLLVPVQYLPHFPFPRPPVEYAPSQIEWAVTVGSFVFSALVFVALLRVFPVLELPVPAGAAVRSAPPGRLRGRLMITTWALAVVMIAWGVFAREQDFAPLRWLTGLALLAAIPLQYCLVKDPAETEPVREAILCKE